MKEIAIVFLLAVIIKFNNSSSNKKDLLYIIEKSQILNREQLVNRFLLETSTTPDKAKKLLQTLEKQKKNILF